MSSLLVQRESGEGRRIVVALEREIEGMYWLNDREKEHCGPITPKWVARIVTMAQACGWSPEKPGAPLHLKFGPHGLVVERS